jgi:hypothetical protein
MSDEFFYTDKDGNKKDAELHEPILNNPEAEKFARNQSREIALRAGIPVKSVDRILPKL